MCQSGTPGPCGTGVMLSYLRNYHLQFGFSNSKLKSLLMCAHPDFAVQHHTHNLAAVTHPKVRTIVGRGSNIREADRTPEPYLYPSSDEGIPRALSTCLPSIVRWLSKDRDNHSNTPRTHWELCFCWHFTSCNSTLHNNRLTKPNRRVVHRYSQGANTVGTCVLSVWG